MIVNKFIAKVKNMSITSKIRKRDIYYDSFKKVWRYQDTGNICNLRKDKPKFS